MEVRSWWLKLFIGLLLGIGCLLQIKTSLGKFLSGKVAVAVSKRKQSTAPIPVVVVCPQNMYRLELMDAYNMTVFSHHSRFDKWPNLASNVEKAWLETQFPLSTLVTHIYAKVNGAICHFDLTSEATT